MFTEVCGERFVGISEAFSTSIMKRLVTVGKVVTRLISEGEITAKATLASKRFERMAARDDESFIDSVAKDIP